MESFDDWPLIGRWSVFDPKKHYNPYKSPPINNKGGFILVLWCYGNLLVSIKTILICINLMFGYSINNLINKRYMYGSFFMVALSFLKSTQILSFPFFLSIITIGDKQVAFSTCYVVSIQPVPCLISRRYRCV